MSIIDNIYSKSPIYFQNILLNLKAIELYFERYGSKFWKLFDEFQKNQWLSEVELTEYQNEKLKLLIKHAYETVPYYNNLMNNLKLKPDDIKTIEDLRKLPLITKDIIKKQYKHLISKNFRSYSLRHGHTSGTTGSPLNLCCDTKTCVIHHAADWRQKYWAGLRYGRQFASIQGRVIVPTTQSNPPFWRKNYINNQLFLSSFHLKEENLPYYFEKLEKDKIKFIEGYPSTVYILAMYLNGIGNTFPLDAVLTSSETLFDFQRESIEKAFCCKVFDFYGMAERVVFATECDHHSGHHLNLDYGITEFLDDNNENVGKGKLGRIIATGLHNFAMPLIRYQTNDSCSLKNETCGCGRGFPLMDDVTTKDESIITLPDGRLVSPSILTHPFKPMHNIVESQIVQEDLHNITVNIVKTSAYSDKDSEVLIKAMKDRLGDDVNISLEFVESIPRTRNGKFRWVISKVPLKF